MYQQMVPHHWRSAGVVLLLSLLSVSGWAGVNRWTSLGPNLGWVRALAVDPRNSSVIYQHTYQDEPPPIGQLHKSADGGRTFSVILPDCFPIFYSAPVLSIDPRDSNTVYGVCEWGLRRSNDGGIHWQTLVGGREEGFLIFDFAIDPGNSRVLYAVGGNGIGRSPGLFVKTEDGGSTWVSSRLSSTPLDQLVIDPHNRQVLFAADSEGNVFKTIDGGTNWSSTRVVSPYYDTFVDLAIDPHNSSFLMASVAAPYDLPEMFVRSMDGGATWETIETQLSSLRPGAVVEWVNAIAFDPVVPGTVYVGGGGGVYRSTDRGSTWTRLREGLVPHRFFDREPSIHVMSLAFDPSNPRRLIAGTPDGLFEMEISPAAEAAASGGVFNAASFAKPNAPNGAIARGSIFTIFDTSGFEYPQDQVFRFPLPGRRADEKMSIVASVGTSKDAPLLFIGSTKTNSGEPRGKASAILPSTIPAGNGSLTVYSADYEASFPIRAVDRMFGIFTRDQSGRGAGAIQNEGPDSKLSDNTPLNPARPGQVAVLWGTGLGPVVGDEAAGPLPGSLLTADVNVWVGSKDAQLIYGGRSGCCAGVDQINFVVPDDVEGCQVPVAVQTGEVISNYVTMAVSRDAANCIPGFR